MLTGDSTDEGGTIEADGPDPAAIGGERRPAEIRRCVHRRDPRRYVRPGRRTGAVGGGVGALAGALDDRFGHGVRADGAGRGRVPAALDGRRRAVQTGCGSALLPVPLATVTTAPPPAAPTLAELSVASVTMASATPKGPLAMARSLDWCPVPSPASAIADAGPERVGVGERGGCKGATPKTGTRGRGPGGRRGERSAPRLGLGRRLRGSSARTALSAMTCSGERRSVEKLSGRKGAATSPISLLAPLEMCPEPATLGTEGRRHNNEGGDHLCCRTGDW